MKIYIKRKNEGLKDAYIRIKMRQISSYERKRMRKYE